MGQLAADQFSLVHSAVWTRLNWVYLSQASSVQLSSVLSHLSTLPQFSCSCPPISFIVTIRYDTRCYFNVRAEADASKLNLHRIIELSSLVEGRSLEWSDVRRTVCPSRGRRDLTVTASTLRTRHDALVANTALHSQALFDPRWIRRPDWHLYPSASVPTPPPPSCSLSFQPQNLPFLQILPAAALPFSSSGLTTWIPQTVYCYFWAYTSLLFSFSV